MFQVRSFSQSFSETNLIITVSVAKSSFIRTNFSKNICDCVVSVISKFNFTLGYVIFKKCIFKNNHMDSLTVKDILDAMIYDSYFDQNRNTQTYSCTEGIITEGLANLRLRNSVFNGTNCTQQFRFDFGMSFPFNTRLFTINSSFIDGEIVLSTTDHDFVNKAEDHGFIKVEWFLKLHFEETPFAFSKYNSVCHMLDYDEINPRYIVLFNLIFLKYFIRISDFPTRCQSVFDSYCSCYYYLQQMANVFDCSSTKLRTLPSLVPNFTDLVVLKHNNIRHVGDYFTYFDRIRYLDLANNQIISINDSFLSRLKNSKMLVWLNLTENELRSIPEKFQDLTELDKLWLGGNPIHCDCSMAWMIDWLNNFTTPFRQHIIVD